MSDPVSEVLAEAAREAADALYIVASVDDADVLGRIGFEAVPAVRSEQVREFAAAAAEVGRIVIMVNDVGAAVRGMLRSEVPRALLRRMSVEGGPALALGLGGGPVSDEALAAAYRTWLQLAAEAQLDTLPADDADDEDGDREPFPVEALPPVLRAMVQQGADAQGVDVTLWSVPSFGILAGSVGSTRRVRLSPDWAEPAVLWSAVVAVSGAGKSPPLRELLRPVKERNRELHERSEALQKAHEAEREAQRGDRESGGSSSPPPPSLRAMVQDVTLEGLCTRLADNPRGLLLAVDELAGWIGGFDRYRSGGDVAQWLSLHGADAVQVDRRGAGGSLYVPCAAVSVAGTVQPDVARRLIASEQNRKNGLVARLLLAEPRTRPAVWSDRSIDAGVRDDYRRVVASLLDLQHGADGEPVELALSPEAQTLFVRYYNDNGQETYAASRAGNEDEASALAKLRGGAGRIALLFALARAAEDGTAAMVRTVGAEDMRAAITVARWFAGEARRLYLRWRTYEAQERAGRDRGTLPALAERLASLLPPGQRRTMTQLRDATGRNYSAERMRAALAMLAEAGRARELPKVRGHAHRPAEVWEGLDPTQEVSA